MGLLKTFRFLTIRQKLILTIGSGTLFVIFLTSAIALYQESKVLEQELIDKGIIMATNLSKQSIEPILQDNIWELYKSVKAMGGSTSMPFLSYIVILDRNGRVLAHSNPRVHRIGDSFSDSPFDEKAFQATKTTVQIMPLSKDENLYDIAVPCKVDNEKIGIIRVGLTDRIMRENLTVIKQKILLLAILLSVVSIAVGIFMAHRITSPLKKITQNIIKISKGQFRDVISVKTIEKDEIGQMADVFNEMAKNLRTQKEMDEHLARREKLAMIGELAVNIAHEIKNPLTGIKLGIDTMRNNGSGEEILERLDNEIVRLDKVVSRLLSFTQTSPLTLKKTEIKHIVEDAMFFTSKVAEKKGIKMHSLKIEPDTFVVVDVDQIQQALLNIILNAIHATERGGNIYISSFKDEKWARIVIRDTGKGISPDDLQRIFEPFYSTNPLSSGLGLAIAQRIVTEHGGDIHIDSIRDKGTTVAVILPSSREEKYEPVNRR
ncbi:MAG: ATP-binding protein [Nitrospirota bacterium]